MKARTEIMLSLVAVLMVSVISHFSIMANERAPEDMMDGQMYMVECTAYGAREWIGCTCALYDEDKQFIGYYEFTDTGFGRDGDIERGETVDIYIADEQDAMEWGRKTVYIQIIPSKG